MRTLLLALSLSLSACAAPVQVRVASEFPTAETDALIADASDILGIPLEVTNRSVGAITLDIHDSPGMYRGRNLIRHGCRRASWAAPHPETIAHEIGHALGLDHVDEIGNLMTPSGAGTDITDRQLATMEREAWRLSTCP